MSRTAFKLVSSDEVDLGELTSSLGFLLRMAQLRVFDAFFENLAQYDLKPGEFTVLWVIGLNPDLRQGTLAECLSIRPAHMTKLVQRLVKAGLVRRRTPEDDRRSVHLALTAQGRDFVASHKKDFLAFHRLERGQLSKAEAAMLCSLLRKFTGIEE
jgi:DNA-binding MarR family transcriptional regulator